MNDTRNPWRLPPVYDAQCAPKRMTDARRSGITFYFVRALYCYFGGFDASANAYLEKAQRML